MTKKTINISLFVLNSVLTFYIVKNYSNFLEPFEDEITSLLSGVSFLKNLDFDGSPLIVGNYSPYLTSGPIASIGSAFGWVIGKDFVISRIFNFYFLLFIVTFLVSRIKNFFSDELFLKLNVVIFAVILTPWWFGALYSLGEMFSSSIFAISILLLKSKRNLAFFLMTFSVVFGKLLQILLVAPFLLAFLFLKNKINLKNIFSLLAPIFIYYFLIYFKLESFNIYEYLSQYFGIIYSHQSSGFSLLNNFSFQNFQINLNSSEFSQWSIATKLRTFISPIIFSSLMLFENKNLSKHFVHVYPLVLSISVPYIWFWFFSETKWVRYSQHFLFLIVFFSIVLLISDFNLKSVTKNILIFNLSIFLSSSLLIMIFIFTLLFIKKHQLFRQALIICLLLNSLNIFYESSKLIPYDLQFSNCQDISSIECVNEYLQYNFYTK